MCLVSLCVNEPLAVIMSLSILPLPASLLVKNLTVNTIILSPYFASTASTLFDSAISQHSPGSWLKDTRAR